MLAWLAGLPPAAVYVVLALLAVVENVVPPVPADAAVALGAFLSHRGVTTPLAVFLVLGRQCGRRARGLPGGAPLRPAAVRLAARAGGS